MPPRRRLGDQGTQPLTEAVGAAVLERAAQEQAQQSGSTLESSPEAPQALQAPTPLETAIPEPAEEEQPATAAAEVEHHPAAGAEGLEPEFNRRLSALISATGGKVWITSGYRDEAEQAELYARAVAKYGQAQAGKWAAPPGKSNHNRGLAADMGGDLRLLAMLAPQYGLVLPMGHEPWHIEPVGLRQDPATPPQAYTAPGIREKKSLRDAKGLPVEAMAGLADMVLSEAVGRKIDFTFNPGQPDAKTVRTPTGVPKPLETNLVEEEQAEPQQAQATGGGETGEGGDAESWIREAMRITGVGEDWYEGLKARMMQESGGRNIPQGIVDINTQKGTPAFGPMQVIEPTFNSHKLAGYENWKDPLHNTIAAIRYIQSRYGHPSRLPKGGY